MSPLLAILWTLAFTPAPESCADVAADQAMLAEAWTDRDAAGPDRRTIDSHYQDAALFCVETPEGPVLTEGYYR